MKWGYPIACKIWSLSRVEADIDIHPAKQNYYTVHLSHINTCVFYMYRRYRISNNDVLLTVMTTSNRNNRLKSEMTTLGPACRLLGFKKMSDFFCLFTHFVSAQTMIFNSFYATVICSSYPLGAMDTGDIVGLKCPGLTSDALWQCRRCVRLFIFRYNSLYGLVSSCFRCLDSILNAHNCQFLNSKSL